MDRCRGATCPARCGWKPEGPPGLLVGQRNEGLRTEAAVTARQLIPSNRASNWTLLRTTGPACGFGQVNRPPFSRFMVSTSPVPSQTRSFSRSARRERNT